MSCDKVDALHQGQWWFKSIFHQGQIYTIYKIYQIYQIYQGQWWFKSISADFMFLPLYSKSPHQTNCNLLPILISLMITIRVTSSSNILVVEVVTYLPLPGPACCVCNGADAIYVQQTSTTKKTNDVHHVVCTCWACQIVVWAKFWENGKTTKMNCYSYSKHISFTIDWSILVWIPHIIATIASTP